MANARPIARSDARHWHELPPYTRGLLVGLFRGDARRAVLAAEVAFAGRGVAEVAAECGVCRGTVYRWRARAMEAKSKGRARA